MHLSELGYIVDHDIWLTPKEAAEAWGCAKQTLYQKKHRGEFPDAYLLVDPPSWWIHKDCPVKPRVWTKPPPP